LSVNKTVIGVLVSGSGSNLQALIDNCRLSDFPARIGVVISSRPDAYGLVRAEQAGLPHYHVDRRGFDSDKAYDAAILAKLGDHNVELVVLAGYMRLVGLPILEAYPDAVINLHPSLLPSFPGAHAVRDALEYGVKVTGITIHFADAAYDTGPVIIQEIVPVHQEDNEEMLLERIHKVEHRHLPYAVKLWAEGRLKVEGRRVRILPKSGK
jgi:phosphoribosylglycinamide formyltransferase-1